MLELVVFPAGAEELSIRRPEGSTFLSCRIDGKPMAPTMRGDEVVLYWEPSGSNRRLINLEYESPARPNAAAARPSFSLPCLAFRDSGALFQDEFENLDPSRDWKFLRPNRKTSLREIDWPNARAPARLGSLGELLVRMDSGDLPLVIDADAFRSAGLGPESRLAEASGREPAERSVADLFSRRGLVIVRLPFAAVISVIGIANDWKADAIARSAREAIAAGEDERGRFQSVRHWLESVTPSPLLGRPVVDPAGEPGTRERFGFGGSSRRAATALVAALAAACLGLGSAARSIVFRAGAVALVATIALVLIASGPTALEPAARGLASGCIAALGFQIAFRGRRTRSIASSRRFLVGSGKRSAPTSSSGSGAGAGAIGPAAPGRDGGVNRLD